MIEHDGFQQKKLVAKKEQDNKSNSKLYKPHFINEFGFDAWLGMSFNNKQEAQECIDCVMNHAKVNHPDKYDGFSFYIEEVSI